MYLRDLPGTTLVDLVPELDMKLLTWGGGAHQISVDLEDGDPTIRLGAHEVAATSHGLRALAGFFEIPTKFFDRLEVDERQYLLSSRMQHVGGELTVLWGDEGVVEVHKANQVRVEPHRLVEAALRVFPEEAPIVDWWCDSEDLRIDVIVPQGFDRWTGGDSAVSDITRGGIRFGQDRKNNLAPWVQPLLYRLVCTNGMEIPDEGLRVEARHATPEQIEALFEQEIRRAVERLEGDIQAFYDLRSERLGMDATGILRKMARERGLPERQIGILEDALPGVVEDRITASMFDVVNLMTNQANNSAIRLRSATRRNLQRAGGGLVFDHAERCSKCHSRL